MPNAQIQKYMLRYSESYVGHWSLGLVVLSVFIFICIYSIILRDSSQ